MRLKQEFIAHQTGDDAVLIPTGRAEFSGIVHNLYFNLGCGFYIIIILAL